jgi:hypothetical protein
VFGNAGVCVWIWVGFWVCALCYPAEWFWVRVAELTACVGVRFWIPAAVGFVAEWFGEWPAGELEPAAAEWVGLGSVESSG